MAKYDCEFCTNVKHPLRSAKRYLKEFNLKLLKFVEHGSFGGNPHIFIEGSKADIMKFIEKHYVQEGHTDDLKFFASFITE